MPYVLNPTVMERLARERGVRPSARALALMAGLSHTTLNNMLAGRPASLGTIEALAVALDCPAQPLFRWVPSATSAADRLAR